MEQTTVFTALQSLRLLPPLDRTTIVPRVSVDTDALVQTVGVIWDALKEQRGLFEIMEKENARRRSEQDVRISNFQQDVESKLHQEGKKRMQEDERLRAEIKALRDEMQASMDKLRADLGTIEGTVSSSLDLTVAQLKLQVAQVQQKVSDMDTRLTQMGGDVGRISQQTDSCVRKVDEVAEASRNAVNEILALWHLQPKDVRSALQDGRETELLLGTPALQTLANRCSAVDEKFMLLRRDFNGCTATVQDNVRRITALESDVLTLKVMPNKLTELDASIRAFVVAEDAKLRERIEALETREVAAPQVVATDPSDPLMPQLLKHLHDLQMQVQGLQDAMSRKVDRDELGQFAFKTDLAELAEDVRRLREYVEGLGRHDARPIPTAPSRDTATSAALLSLKDATEALARRLDVVERDLLALKSMVATKDDLEQATHETLRAAEKAINHVYDELRKLIRGASAQPKMDSTSGRFRCLSCNRDAGPLSEDLRERLSRSQFPPSSTLMSRDSPPRAVGRAVVPGNRDGVVTSSRRKLQNYYDWLQTKEEEKATVGNANQAGAGAQQRRRSTTPPKTVWPGAQSGGGSGRQCGDHGSDDPDGIGADGKYYIAVQHTTGTTSRPQSRPQSAGNVRSKSSMKLNDGDNADD